MMAVESKNIGIVMSGGGMQCAYSAGGLKALAKEFGITEPDIIIGGSGSSGTMMYFVARQYDIMEELWTNNIHISTLVSPLRFWKIVDIDYFINDVLEKKNPIDIGAVKESSIRFFVATTRLLSGKIVYFGKEAIDNIYETLRASMAVPIMYGKSVKLSDGKRYIDGYITTSIKAYVKKAADEGAKTVIVFDTTHPITLWYAFLYKLYAFFADKELRREILKYFAGKQRYVLPDDVRVIKIKPKYKLPAWFFDSDTEDISKTFYLGYRDTYEIIDKKKVFQKNDVA